jgi:hypothetical protein
MEIHSTVLVNFGWHAWVPEQLQILQSGEAAFVDAFQVSAEQGSETP